MADGRHDVLDIAEIGRRLREARAARQLSLDVVAKACDISPSMLSQVERGIVTPSLSTLYAISQKLNVPMFDLFGSTAEQLSVGRAGQRDTFSPAASGVTYERLSATNLRGLQVIEMRLHLGVDTFDHSLSHAGEECVVVQEGKAIIKVGTEELELAEGDSLSFVARLPHSFRSLGKRDARLIVAMSPPAF